MPVEVKAGSLVLLHGANVHKRCGGLASGAFGHRGWRLVGRGRGGSAQRRVRSAACSSSGLDASAAPARQRRSSAVPRPDHLRSAHPRHPACTAARRTRARSRATRTPSTLWRGRLATRARLAAPACCCRAVLLAGQATAQAACLVWHCCLSARPLLTAASPACRHVPPCCRWEAHNWLRRRPDLPFEPVYDDDAEGAVATGSQQSLPAFTHRIGGGPKRVLAPAAGAAAAAGARPY